MIWGQDGKVPPDHTCRGERPLCESFIKASSSYHGTSWEPQLLFLVITWTLLLQYCNQNQSSHWHGSRLVLRSGGS